MNAQATPRLIKQTFVDRLVAEHGLKKKEFVELKKINDDALRAQKLQQRKSKDDHMVFNYLWRKFPETMATKNQDPRLLRQEIGNLEFEKILKMARRRYGFWAYTNCAITAISFIGANLSTIWHTFGIISFACCLISITPLVFTWNYYFSPDNLHVYETDRREYLREIYRNRSKVSENQDE